VDEAEGWAVVDTVVVVKWADVEAAAVDVHGFHKNPV
jgi:hypothetical protein